MIVSCCVIEHYNEADSALFGTPIAGELVKDGYLGLSCFSGAMLLAGACLIAASRLQQNRSLKARI